MGARSCTMCSCATESSSPRFGIKGYGSGTLAAPATARSRIPIALGTLATVDGMRTTFGGTTTRSRARNGMRSSAKKDQARFGSSSSGDIHVVDVSDFAAPREVAFFHLDGAGTHNFSVDEIARNSLRRLLQRRRAGDRYYRRPVQLRRRRQGREMRTLRPRPDGSRARPRTRRRPAGLRLGRPLSGGRVYASDMLNGIWKLGEAFVPAGLKPRVVQTVRDEGLSNPVTPEWSNNEATDSAAQRSRQRLS